MTYRHARFLLATLLVAGSAFAANRPAGYTTICNENKTCSVAANTQVAFGRAEESDELADVTVADLVPKEDLGKGRYLFSGSLSIDRSGSFGYTVRVLPTHSALASRAELGLIVNA